MIFGVILGFLLLLCGAFLVNVYVEISKMASLKTQEVIEGVFAIQDTFVNLFLIKSGNKYIAIDAGNRIEHIREEFKQLKIDPHNVVAVFLTHTDSDHIAALSLFENAIIYLSHAEEQMINGQTSRMPFIKNTLEYRYELLEDNHILDISGLQVRGMLTPGHTPGSMCYLMNETYLFTGDSMSLQKGNVTEFNKFFNMDSATQRISLKKLLDLPSVTHIFTAHYGFTDNYHKAFDNWKE